MPSSRGSVRFLCIYVCRKGFQKYQKGLIPMNGKVHQTDEEKFIESLKPWGDDDNRPFVRVKIDKEKDRIAYLKKSEKIQEERKRISVITGDHLENINLIDPWGHIYSKGGNIRDFES